jgi:hypothetical protein
LSWNQLSTEDSEAIVAELLGGLDLPVRERITSAAEGNPLYVEQDHPRCWSRAAPSSARVIEWVATGRSGDIAIPPTVEALVGARLDALRHEDRQVIDPASVIGLGSSPSKRSSTSFRKKRPRRSCHVSRR